MDEPDLYDDILGGTLSPALVPCVEALLEVGVNRRVLRLPGGGVSPLRTVREAVGRLLGSDAGLRDAVGTARLVFQRRSLKFDTWVDLESTDERPVADGERLRAMPVTDLEAGEVLSGEETAGRRRRAEKRRHKKRRHRSRSADSGRRRRSRRRHRSRSTTRVSSGAESDDGEVKRCRRRRHRHSRRHRRSRSRGGSSDSNSGRSRSGSRRAHSESSSRSSRRSNSDSESSSDGGRRGGSSRRSSSSARRPTTSRGSGHWRDAAPWIGSKQRVPPPRQVSAQAWQHMDPEFAEQLRQYELERARREGREELCKHLSEVADISDGELSSSSSEPPRRHGRADGRGGGGNGRGGGADGRGGGGNGRGGGADGRGGGADGEGGRADGESGEEDGKASAAPQKDAGKPKDKDMSDLGLRVLDRLKKLREEFGVANDVRTSTDEMTTEMSTERADEVTREVEGRVYAAYLNLDGKNPVMALHEYCTARRWEAPFFHLTERPSDSSKQKLFTAAVRVNRRMFTLTEPMASKKDGKRGAALYCLQKLGVLKAGGGGPSQADGVDCIELP